MKVSVAASYWHILGHNDIRKIIRINKYLVILLISNKHDSIQITKMEKCPLLQPPSPHFGQRFSSLCSKLL